MKFKVPTLTEKIVKELVHGIVIGRWPVGEMLPTEKELCERFKCSRVTIRRALDAIEKAGMIERRPRIGTKVISTGAGIGFSYALSRIDDLDQLAKDHSRVVLNAEVLTLDKKSAAAIGSLVGTKVVRLSNIRVGQRKDDPPIVFTHVYFSSKYSSLIDVIKANPDILAVHTIEQASHKECREVQQSIHAVLLPKQLSSILCVSENSPALMILRRYLDAAGQPLLISQSWHPGHRYAFSLNFKKND